MWNYIVHCGIICSVGSVRVVFTSVILSFANCGIDKCGIGKTLEFDWQVWNL